MRRLFQPDYPFDPKNVPVFYGWVVMVMSTLGVLATIPGQTAGVGPFTEHLLDALELSRVELSTAYMLGTLSSGFLIPHCGQFCDRWGARRMIVIVLVAFSLSLILMSQCDAIYHALKTPLIKDSLLSLTIITLGFFLIRFLGQGMLSIVSRTMVSKWFNRKRGLVTAISGSCTAVAFSCAPLLLHQGVSHFGWRETFLYLGIFYGTGLLFICWLLFRDNPEESSLLMDGEAPTLDDESSSSGFSEFKTYHEFNANEALKTLPFWLFTGALCLHGFMMTAIYFHAEALSQETGITLERFYWLLYPTAVINISLGFLLGWLNNKTRLKFLLIAYLLFLSLLPVTIHFLDTLPGQISYIMTNATTGAFFGNLFNVTWPRFFGRAHLGKINSWVTSATVIASALGPFIFSLLQKFNGTYQTALWLCSATSLLMLCFAHRANNPQQKYANSL